jgi:Domain of unknown function (DUF5134)
VVGALWLRWLLTAIFAVAGLGSLLPRGRTTSASIADRISDAFHVLMSAALIAMTWRAEPALLLWFQAALFAGAVVWFGLARSSRITRARAPEVSGLHHAIMAAAMIWMLTVLSAATPMAADTSATGATPATRSAAGAMPAMTAMPAMRASARSTTVLVLSTLLVVYLAAAAISWLVRAVGPGRGERDAAAAGHAAMSAGMAVMLLAML